MKNQFLLSFALSAAWLLISNLAPADAITTSGQISGEETWSGTVHLTGDVTVTSTGKLTILGGTTVECEPNSDSAKSGADSLHTEIIVNGGALIAKGSSDQRIVFTSSAAVKDSGNWYGLRFIGASVTTVVQYCTVRYGVNGISVERGAISSIEQCIVENCSRNGMSFVASAILTACTARKNGKYGISWQGAGRLSQCTVSGNGDDGVHGTAMVVIDTQSLVEGNTGDGVEGGSVTAKDSQFLNNKGNGVSCMTGGGTLTACTIRNNVKYGVLLQQTGRVSQCTVSDNGDDGVHGTAGNTAIIDGQSRIENNAGDGFEGGSITAWNSNFTGNKGHGINISSTPTPVSIIGCLLETNGKTGLYAYGQRINNCSITVTNTTARGNAEEGLFIYVFRYSSSDNSNNWNLTIDGNSLEGNGKYGMSIQSIYDTAGSSKTDYWKVVVHGNKYNGNGLHGLYLCSNAGSCYNWDVSISENTMAGNSNDAINVSASTMQKLRITVAGNTLQNNAFGVNITADGTCTADVSDNAIQVSGRSGIYVSGTDSLSIQRNTLQDNMEAGVQLASAPDSVAMSSNTISGVSLYGVRLDSAASGVTEVKGIENNNIENDGMYVFDNESAAKIIAPNNYWGPAASLEMNSGQQNISLIYDSHDKSGLGEVVFKPYLLAGGGTASGILGDVNNSKTVNISDALIVASYDLDHSIAIPDSGNIQLGDVNKDSSVNITDALIIATYDIDPANVNLPTGIGQPAGAAKPAVANNNIDASNPEKSITAAVISSDAEWKPGQKINVVVTMDMTVMKEKLGAYSATLFWDPAVLKYVGVGSDGFERLSAANTAGELKFNRFDVMGAEGIVPLVKATFIILADISGDPFRVEFSSLAAAQTFHDLLPHLTLTQKNELAARSRNSTPGTFSLFSNYPNPFNASTIITFQLPMKTNVKLKVYSVNGQMIRTLLDRETEAGTHSVTWDGKNDKGGEVASGVYLYRLETGAEMKMRKMLYMR